MRQDAHARAEAPGKPPAADGRNAASSRASASGSSPRAPLEPRPVLVGHERRQRRAVVVRGDRREAAASDQRRAAALGLDTTARLGVVGDRDELLLARPDLERERALSRLGHELLRIETQPDLVRRARAGRARRRRARSRRGRARPRFRSRVSTLPRSGSTTSDGSSASSCARRRTDAVPTRIPGRSPLAPHSASRGSSRGGYAPTASPSVSVEVMSLAECTATSIRPASSASSSSLTKTPRSPIWPNGFERSRSPTVVIGTSAISTPGRRSASTAPSAWVSASLLPRVPTRRTTAAAAGGDVNLSAPARSTRADADESGRRLQRERAAGRDGPRHLRRSSSPSPNRWRTTSA